MNTRYSIKLVVYYCISMGDADREDVVELVSLVLLETLVVNSFENIGISLRKT